MTTIAKMKREELIRELLDTRRSLSIMSEDRQIWFNTAQMQCNVMSQAQTELDQLQRNNKLLIHAPGIIAGGTVFDLFIGIILGSIALS